MVRYLLSSRYNAMLALRLACLIIMYIYTRAEFVNPSVVRQISMDPHDVISIRGPITNADAVAVSLPNPVECYNAVLKLCKTKWNGLQRPCS